MYVSLYKYTSCSINRNTDTSFDLARFDSGFIISWSYLNFNLANNAAIVKQVLLFASI